MTQVEQGRIPSWRRGRGRFRTPSALLLTALVWSGANAQQTQDDRFEVFLLDNICSNPSLTSISDGVVDTCITLITGGASSAATSSLPSAGNFGVTTAAAGAAQRGVSQQRTGVDERLQELREGEAGVSGGELGGGFGAFVAGHIGDADRDTTAFQTGFESNVRGLTLGLDYRPSDTLVFGAAYGLSADDADFVDHSGHLESLNRTLTLYATYLPVHNAFVSAYAGYGKTSIESSRLASVATISETAIGNTDSTQSLLGASAGYDWAFGRTTLGVWADVDYSLADVDRFAESAPSLGLLVPGQKIRSLQGTLGVRVSHWTQVGSFAVVPEARLAYVHEFADDKRRIGNQLAGAPGPTFNTETDDPDRDFLRYGAGVTVQVHRQAQAFVDYESMLGHSFMDNWTLSAGILAEF